LAAKAIGPAYPLAKFSAELRSDSSGLAWPVTVGRWLTSACSGRVPRFARALAAEAVVR